jgi:hypothetical protein
MQNLSSGKSNNFSILAEKNTNSDLFLTRKSLERIELNELPESPITNRSFHLSICVNNLELTRNFYKNILGLEERRATKSSAHFNFYGCQLTFHEVEGYNAKNIQREVDAEDVPVPHFGAALSFEEFERLKERLIAHGVNFFKKPRLRFVGKKHEQHVFFLEDPSGHGIEIKSFTNIPVGDWV